MKINVKIKKDEKMTTMYKIKLASEGNLKKMMELKENFSQSCMNLAFYNLHIDVVKFLYNQGLQIPQKKDCVPKLPDGEYCIRCNKYYKYYVITTSGEYESNFHSLKALSSVENICEKCKEEYEKIKDAKHKENFVMKILEKYKQYKEKKKIEEKNWAYFWIKESEFEDEVDELEEINKLERSAWSKENHELTYLQTKCRWKNKINLKEEKKKIREMKEFLKEIKFGDL